MYEIPKNLFDKFYINKKWFKHNLFGVHGILHQYRVLTLSYLISKMENVDINILCYAAIFHDVRRNNDGIDFFHGKRAARWLLKNFSDLKDLSKICDVIFWHNIDDNKILKLTKEIKCFKDADALDRWRIGIFDKRFLRTYSSKKLIFFSCKLFILTEENKNIIKDPKKNILKVLKEMGCLD